MTQLGETDAKELFSLWVRVTNRMGSEDMTPHLVEAMDREHPTLRQQMVAMMASLLNMMDTTHIPDDRDAASCAFLIEFQGWLKDYEGQRLNWSHLEHLERPSIYISPKGEIKFPFI